MTDEDIQNNDRDERGWFLPGNQFWLARSSHGPKPKFDDPDTLWEACVEYFQWCEDNPLFEDKVGFYEGRAIHTPTPKLRAMTIGGLCLFLDITQRVWRDWREERTDLIPVITNAEEVIKTQKFTGAAAGLLNANIIARDLGLAENTQLSGPGGGAIPTANAIVTGEELRAMIKQAEQDV
jgi:hypothetical protein